MIARQAIRKAALAASVMESRARDRLLASLEPVLADQIATAIEEVRRMGWARPELVRMFLASSSERQAPDSGTDPGGLCRLASHMDSTSFSRVLAAQGTDRRDFLLSVLEPCYAGEVKRHLAAMPALPDRLRVATIEAAAVLADSQCEKVA